MALALYPMSTGNNVSLHTHTHSHQPLPKPTRHGYSALGLLQLDSTQVIPQAGNLRGFTGVSTPGPQVV